MNDLKHMTDIVKDVLTNIPETRNSDFALYKEVCKVTNPAVMGMPFGSVLNCHKELNLPSFESVTRARRKIVAKNPLLAGDSDVEAVRTEKESEFREYAKAVN